MTIRKRIASLCAGASLVLGAGVALTAGGADAEEKSDVRPTTTAASEPTKLIDKVYALTPYGAKVSGATNGTLPALETATFGAGCFWGVEARYRELDGVIATAVGYSGGTTDKPTYEQVCSDSTGHAEVVEVKFDPAVVSYEQLMMVFWNNHNPTQLNRQGPDVGRQYRSAVFYHSESQRTAAEKTKAALTTSGVWKKPIVTEISKAGTFFAAETYHQQYLEKRGQTSCSVPGGH